ncbi:Uncharacterised protein [Mycobacteroides abscessus subsp. abscessus]|uniref:hypothetical protein n=1 Tax=Mycobacteroides abscessus TaxID=36809 RepID=UPI00092B4819|nr:hypothetical protein [Mycobacteroides abscessus]MBN7327736.1 hypothetical protein [Mycobacteroides abscessus subsp. abscessus]SID63079.1 Uncharacterised protein [Mycobacteroides abscessus subsp. abscessus]SIE82391.1 Uncharacterised protein [Mycobacteroides abscessus subsp. abscessus]SIF73201.1 Uncharacterised protein [Mycobacteroides abscessus subsp. abscessus]SIF73267.1 Uncharacterised protein [Mycobacteroides abscessus subsp. abscessus]
MTETITADEVLAELRKGRSISAVDEIRREVQLPTPDPCIQAYAAVRDREVEVTAYWPECAERHVTAQVSYWRFEQAFLRTAEPDARWYTIARIAETVRDVANGLATALTATEGRTPLGYVSDPCDACSGGGVITRRVVAEFV